MGKLSIAQTEHRPWSTCRKILGTCMTVDSEGRRNIYRSLRGERTDPGTPHGPACSEPALKGGQARLKEKG